LTFKLPLFKLAHQQGNQFPQLTLVMKRAVLWRLQALLFLMLAGTGFSQTVVPAWVQRYGSPAAQSTDIAFLVTTDSASNVVVAGYSDAGISQPDLVLIKYTASGVPVWTNRLDGRVTALKPQSAWQWTPATTWSSPCNRKGWGRAMIF
jgi:hypothetical protein